MGSRLEVEILPQPDNETCGATCLHAVYQYYGEQANLSRVIAEVPRLDTGGTLGALLASHALARGYSATIYTYNLQVFDPTWFARDDIDIPSRLTLRAESRSEPRLRAAIEAYMRYFSLGGRIVLQDLTPDLIRCYLDREIPIITGLSSTYLYRTAREWGPRCEDNDISGDAAGHFVVLCGYDRSNRTVLVADPYRANPAGTEKYEVDINRVVCSILLGILTHDANLVIIEPAAG